MKTVKTAIIGTGFMGRVHLEALRRIFNVEPVAIVCRNQDAARRIGAGFGVSKFTTDYHDVLRDSAIDAVHICTPNAQHFPMAKDALLAGKHVLCEKPLAISVEQGEELVALAQQKKLRNCVCHNLRYYPMVQQMRQMSADGDLGEVLIVQGTYFQDWLLHDTDWNWRVDGSFGGPSRCMADIGSHWFDMAEHITGLRVTSLCADLQTFHPTRKRPKGSVETFANKTLSANDYVETVIDTEDFGAVVFRMGSRTRGNMSASQVSAGRKNRFNVEIYGAKASVAWSQERPDELWVGHRDKGNEIVIKDPSLLGPKAQSYADLPGGHSEGYDDTFKQVFRRFYSSIATPGSAAEYPEFAEGLRQLVILDAVLESSRRRSWIDLSNSTA
jgi:predicted dehydrogenase